MAMLVLSVVDEADVNGRDIVSTGISMLGLEGDDVVCGRCGREMMSQVPIRTMPVGLLYRCEVCGALNEVPADVP
ncbi:hypothetical protein [Magnetospirillum molischianum]|uniref:Uncharacterized protein n=1 Tax=Magnetospirillum molischianum DSM 120 TaxID=1150626 RepID=H8FTC8_MAGML|nr:hypothetical protein [Magnetospirillum molischianum]CCG41616.1 conserved hypothetical protein [Magnetospirillum molischianum DSM 120]